jgi:putative phage-type endonuclease
LAYRTRGIGASEVGTILGLDPYKSSIELYYEKIGQNPKGDFENLAMFLGKELEDFIAKMWQHYDGTTEGMMLNYRFGKVHRQCKKVHAYAHNPAYPWLFVSLDRHITGEREGSLEIKTMNSYVSKQWESGIPPQYVVQLQTQLMVCGFEWGELVILEDNRKFEVIPFEKNDSICATIVERTKTFWNRVQQGRLMAMQQEDAQHHGNFTQAAELQAEIDQLAPEPDNSESYNEFLNTKYHTPTRSELQGTPVHYQMASEHKRVQGQIAELEKEKMLFENQLKAVIGEYEVLNFMQDGKVTWAANKKGTRVFRNSVK